MFRRGFTLIELLIVIATIAMLLAILLPALLAAREVALKAQISNNLRQVGLGLHKYVAIHEGLLPARAIFDIQGKPLLSWRVLLLPLLGEGKLYEQFHLDESWESDHNKPLIARMPSIFQDPRRPSDGTTTFLAAVGNGLSFEGNTPLTISDLREGASNTIMVVQASHERAVPWTKPDDLEVDPAMPNAELGDAGRDGFEALFVDGSVRTISKAIDAAVFKALFTRGSTATTSALSGPEDR
jgi:prepilin-type N-terminal cleavage/methylation domain-containing protein